jgi:ArsR family metal-binding transcriptional regulator
VIVGIKMLKREKLLVEMYSVSEISLETRIKIHDAIKTAINSVSEKAEDIEMKKVRVYLKHEPNTYCNNCGGYTGEVTHCWFCNKFRNTEPYPQIEFYHTFCSESCYKGYKGFLIGQEEARRLNSQSGEQQ